MNWNCKSSVQNNIPSFNPIAAKMAKKKKVWKTENFLNSSKFQGRNSCKNESITLKHVLEQ
jgi:hypothetical protein